MKLGATLNNNITSETAIPKRKQIPSKREILEFFKKHYSFFTASEELEKISMESVSQHISSLKGVTISKEEMTGIEQLVRSRHALLEKDALLVAAGLAYLLLILDVIPDVTPIIGLADDLFILSLIWKRVSDRLTNITEEPQEKQKEEISEEIREEQEGKVEEGTKTTDPYRSAVF